MNKGKEYKSGAPKKEGFPIATVQGERAPHLNSCEPTVTTERRTKKGKE